MTKTEQFLYDIKYDKHEALNTILHMIVGATLLIVIGYYIPLVYLQFFDTKSYYQIINPITVENKNNVVCTYIDAYINRRVLSPILGTAVRQLTLIRAKDGKTVRMQSYTTDIQSDTGSSGVMIAHWPLPCNIPLGTYFFEGTVRYEVRGLPKYTHFYTENFEIVATPAGELQAK